MTAKKTTADLTATVRATAVPPEILDRLADDGFAWIPETGRGIVTGGVATRVALETAAEAVASIPVSRESGVPDDVGPLAVGATGWSLDHPMVVPARTTIVHGERAWEVRVSPAGEPDRTASPPPTLPRRFTVEACQSHRQWCERVSDAIALLDSDPLTKIVLARQVLVGADAELDRRSVLARLRHDQPGCVIYAHGPFVGASPELLVSRHGSSVRSRPMAGTVARHATHTDDDRAVSSLLNSNKQGDEHSQVVDAVVERLRGLGADPSVTGPSAQRFASVTHLVTEVEARLSGVDAATIASTLHPTPAVGGTPTDTARRTIEKLEGFDRGLYAGPVGWVDAIGDGEFMVALRSATLDGNSATLVAGAGIVPASDPQAEWEETQAKLEPVLRAVLRP